MTKRASADIDRFPSATALLGTVILIGLEGCNLAPRYAAPALPTPVAYKEVGDWQPARPLDELPRGRWWEVYGDPLLDDLEQGVEKNNPTLAAAANAYERARSYTAEAGAAYFPRLDSDGSLSTNKQSANRPLRSAGQPTYYGANTLDGQATYELDLWGRVRDTVASARALAQAQAADFQSVRLMLEAELAIDYAGLRGLDDQADLLQKTVATYQQAYDLTRALFTGKIASPIDVTRAATQLHDAEAQVSDVASRRALLEHAIAALIGKAPVEVNIQSERRDIKVPRIPLGVPSSLLERRPDIAAAERRAASANQRIGIARAAYFPNISIGATAGFQNTSLNLLNIPQTFWSLGPNMTLPIFEGGLLHARLRESRAAFEESANDYRATVLSAFREVEDNLSLLRGLEHEEQEQTEAAKAAQDTVDMSMTLYTNGASSYLDVVTAQTAALSAQRSVLALQTERVQASVRLVRAIGGGWSRDDDLFQQLPRLGQAVTAR